MQTPSDPFDQLADAELAFARLSELEDPAAIAAFLAEHEHLRDMLESILDRDSLDEGDTERVVGDFRIVRELGRGGMGVVFEARQLSLDRAVALKLLAPELSLDPASIARFRREATLAASLEHPSIAKVLGFVHDEDDGHYLVMELVPGVPLDAVVRWLAEHHPDPRERTAQHVRACIAAAGAALPIASPESRVTSSRTDVATVWDGSYERCIASLTAQIADALDHAHAAGVIHRDVKPANILLRPDGRAVLTDFGLARRAGNAGVTLTGEMAGTPAYQSPEQITGNSRELGPATDIFSLGATLYELLTLRKPFEGATIAEVQDLVLGGEPPRLARANPRVDRDLASIDARALEKRVHDRYPSAAAFAADLRNYLAGRPVVARPVSIGVRAQRWCRRNPLAASFVALLTIALVTTGWLWKVSADAFARERTLLVGARADALFADDVNRLPATPDNLEHYRVALARAQAIVADRALLVAELSVPEARPTAERQLAVLDRIAADVLPELERRAIWSTRVVVETVDRHAANWRAAAADVAADSKFAGFELRPQLGLVPLHRDPKSGLWEFVFWHGGDNRMPSVVDGRVRIDAETNIVFVLVPPIAPGEAPFFLSKFEMSRGQWRGLGGRLWQAVSANNPKPSRDDLCYPVVEQSWVEIDALLSRHGLTLPTGAQWEHACRAGTTTTWWFGDEPLQLTEYENVRDQSLERAKASYEPPAQFGYHGGDDGFPGPAPVDAFPPNPWGLHQMLGNFYELCADARREPGRDTPIGQHATCGGGMFRSFHEAKPDFRSHISDDVHHPLIGFRPMRLVD